MSAVSVLKRTTERALRPLETALRPAYRAAFRAGRRANRQSGPAGADMTAGITVAQKDEDADGVHLWVAAFLHDRTTETVAVQVRLLDGTDEVHSVTCELLRFVIDDELVVTGWDPRSRLFHRHVALPTEGVVRGRDYTATATVLPAESTDLAPAQCTVRLLPRDLPDGQSLRIVVGSCYDAYTDDHSRVPRAYAAHVPTDLGGPPDLTLLLGDQVYADTPWWSYALQAQATPRTSALLEYWSSWGMQTPEGHDPTAERGLAPFLRHGPTWFLPDDHEFWNNWPHASATAKHSFLNQARGVVGGLFRSAAAVRDLFVDVAPRVPTFPGVVPEGATERNHLPVHPDEWGRWSRAAFDLFGAFQTRSARERDGGPITRGGYSDDPANDPFRPPADGPVGVIHRPLTPPVQIVDVEPVRVVLLDTRTRRTRSRTNKRFSRFVDDEFVDATVAAATAPEAAVFVLATQEPLLAAPAGWRPSVPGFSDFGVRHYTVQYVDFWTRLLAARDGRPTVLVGGDIHRSYVAHAEPYGVIQVVTSPLSLVYGYNTTEAWRFRHEPASMPQVLEDPWPPAVQAIGMRGHPTHRNGFAGLAFERTGGDTYRLRVDLYPINEYDEVLSVDYDLVTAGPSRGIAPTATPASAPAPPRA
ncbi:hypothetical protein ACQPX6_25135 [Actinomycetospora sp. CA-101289]|uniref:hypothetical protein n=1 Tax=Actinomycetospora sp. CA-101289 TaxID=3239893 RepID=UPI003D98A537